ncbi:MAG TPA: hypothetical protein VGH87_05385, partial [Polyangiaceae bacterium]
MHAPLELSERSRSGGVDHRTPTARRRRVPSTFGEPRAVVEIGFRDLLAKVDPKDPNAQTTPPYRIAISMPSIFDAPNSLL